MGLLPRQNWDKVEPKEEASYSFMHAPLGSGDIARLVELRSCNWVVAITEDRNVPLKDSTETKMGCQERRGGRMGSWSDLVGQSGSEKGNDSFLKPAFLRPKSRAERGESPPFLVLL
ncbi:hypothetical protein T459_23932 [Capsicum annuum]|uniref:Uncharacterized protein n=1 Tax=Capsicum annuum TaxID=4072 RepID=A0A2G2YTP4_CAPAN|nr:hypothetical protein T459_23932 [Capsicum annuum]